MQKCVALCQSNVTKTGNSAQAPLFTDLFAEERLGLHRTDTVGQETSEGQPTQHTQDENKASPAGG